MKEVLHKFIEYALHPASGYVLFVISVAVSVLIYFKQKSEKIPRYRLRSFNVVNKFGAQLDSVKITHNGEPIKQLTVTKLLFWNAGSQTIKGSDIAQNDPIHIVVKNGCEILQTSLLFEKRTANAVRLIRNVDITRNEIAFDFLDGGDGAIILILHTGGSSMDVSLRGTIMGARSIAHHGSSRIIRRILLGPTKQRVRTRPPSFTSIVIACVVVPVIVGSFVISDFANQPMPVAVRIILASILCLLYWLLAAAAFVIRVPKGFDSFFEDFDKPLRAS